MVPLVTTSIYLKIWEIREPGTIMTMLIVHGRKAQLKQKKPYLS